MPKIIPILEIDTLAIILRDSIDGRGCLIYNKGEDKSEDNI